MNSLILDGNVLLETLVHRRDAIGELLANVSAVAKELTGLVADNEAKLAPTLDRLNSVAAMLEKNRDNLSKALPGLKKFEITSGESVSNGFYYNAFVPNLAIPELIQPFFDYYWGSGATTRTCRGRCSPGRTTAFRVVRDDRAPTRGRAVGRCSWPRADSWCARRSFVR